MEQQPPSTKHPVISAGVRIQGVLKDIADVNPVFMSLADKRNALLMWTQLSDQVEAQRMKIITASGDVAEAEGFRNVASWMAPRTRTEYGPNAGAERLAGDLDTRWRQVGAGLADGRVNLAQTRVIVRALEALGDDVDPDLLAKAEAHLVEQAEHFNPKQLKALGDRILEVIAPDLYEDQEREKLEAALRRASAATRLTMRRRGDGSTDVHARVPDAVATRLKTLLDAHSSPRHDANTPGTALTDPATGKRLPYDRIQGIAFCSMLEGIDPTRTPSQGGSATTCVVTMPLADLKAGVGVATLFDGTHIPVGEFRRLACNAGIIPAVLDGASEPLDLGRTQRLFSAAQRRAMGIGHPTCRADGYSIPADWCEAHHWRDPWNKGGKTDLADGKLLCPWHHHRAHDDTYITKYLPNGDVRFHKRR